MRRTPMEVRAWRASIILFLMLAPLVGVAYAVENLTDDTRLHRFTLYAVMGLTLAGVGVLMRLPVMREWWRVKKHLRGDPREVPCPGCAYPLFEPSEAERTHTCPECGHITREDDAVASWDRVDGVRVPLWWVERLMRHGTVESGSVVNTD